MIVERIDAYLRAQNRTLDQTLLASAAFRSSHAIKRQLMENQETRGLGLSTPLYCKRKAAYAYHKIEGEAPEPRAYLTRLGGDLFEIAVLTLAKLAGCDIGVGQGEVSLKVPNVQPGASGEILGHIDDLLHHEGKYWVVEVKSVTQQGMDRFERDPIEWAMAWDYYGQGQRYAHAVGAEGVLFLVICRDTGRLKEAAMALDRDYLTTALGIYQEVMGSKAPEDLPRGFETEPELEKVQGKAKVPPEKEAIAVRNGAWFSWPTGRQILGKQCGYCAHKIACWGSNLKALETQTGKPVWVIEAEEVKA